MQVAKVTMMTNGQIFRAGCAELWNPHILNTNLAALDYFRKRARSIQLSKQKCIYHRIPNT